MQVFEEQKIYGDVGFKLIHYETVMYRRRIQTDSAVFTEMNINTAELQEAGREFENISKKIFRRMEAKYGEFTNAGRAAVGLLSDYGLNDLIIQYNHGGPFGFENAEIVEAETETGGQALELIEHCMNEFKGIPGFVPVSEIPFGVLEAKSGSSRCAALFTGANHLAISEYCVIFVGEK